jgi:hypothetical protein
MGMRAGTATRAGRTFTDHERTAQALALHSSYSGRWCAEDGLKWPCPTVLALNPEMEDE